MTIQYRHRKQTTLTTPSACPGRRRIMTEKCLPPWPNLIVIKWNHFHDNAYFVTEWIHIDDENGQSVTTQQMWRDPYDQIGIVTNSSQIFICDDTCIFRDAIRTSPMIRSLLVIGRNWNLQTLSTTTQWIAGVSVRNKFESEREGTNKSQANEEWHGDLFYRGSVLANLIPVEVVTKTGSLSTLSLSQTVT
jgi:hypothetical protein